MTALKPVAQPAVVITGASSGIGRAIALTLADAGFHVFAGVRQESDGAALTAATSAITPLIIDVTKPDLVAAAAASVQEVVREHGIAALVNNAGVGMTGPLEALPVDTLRKQYEINVFGQVTVTQAFLPLLRKAAGRIVNTGSVGDRLTLPFGAPLASSKWAFASITEALRLELRPWGIHVILIEPASISTDAVSKVEQDTARVIEQFDDVQRARYARTYEGMIRRLVRRERKGSSPQVVGDAVLKAITASRPRTRYLVGKDSRKLALLGDLMPDRMFDLVRVLMFGLPKRRGSMRSEDAALVAQKQLGQ